MYFSILKIISDSCTVHKIRFCQRFCRGQRWGSLEHSLRLPSWFKAALLLTRGKGGRKESEVVETLHTPLAWSGHQWSTWHPLSERHRLALSFVCCADTEGVPTSLSRGVSWHEFHVWFSLIHYTEWNKWLSSWYETALTRQVLTLNILWRNNSVITQSFTRNELIQCHKTSQLLLRHLIKMCLNCMWRHPVTCKHKWHDRSSPRSEEKASDWLPNAFSKTNVMCQVPSLQCTSHVAMCFHRQVWYIVHYLCAMHVLAVWALSSSQILLVLRPPLLSMPMQKNLVFNHSLNHPAYLMPGEWKLSLWNKWLVAVNTESTNWAKKSVRFTSLNDSDMSCELLCCAESDAAACALPASTELQTGQQWTTIRKKNKNLLVV